MLRTTVIMKTDLARSTEHIRKLTAPELDTMLFNQTQLILPIAEQHHGQHLKGEGDSFWITFPSVTAAAQAAIAFQHALRHAQIGQSEQDRLLMRAVIALGDALHKDNDIFGPVMALAARMEGITPANEIYLSHAAWLALNHAEIKTVFMDSVMLKGFDEPERIYRVIQQESIRVETQQVVVSADLGRFTTFARERSRENLGKALSQLETLAMVSTLPNNGRLRVMAGDSFILTFELPIQAFSAIDAWAQMWVEFLEQTDYDLPLRIGLHQGDYYIFRTHLFGDTINQAVWLTRYAAQMNKPDKATIVLSTEIYDALKDTQHAQRFQRDTIPPDIRDRFNSDHIYFLML